MFFFSALLIQLPNDCSKEAKETRFVESQGRRRSVQRRRDRHLRDPSDKHVSNFSHVPNQKGDLLFRFPQHHLNTPQQCLFH
jgi:hypothetical protein